MQPPSYSCTVPCSLGYPASPLPLSTRMKLCSSIRGNSNVSRTVGIQNDSLGTSRLSEPVFLSHTYPLDMSSTSNKHATQFSELSPPRRSSWMHLSCPSSVSRSSPSVLPKAQDHTRPCGAEAAEEGRGFHGERTGYAPLQTSSRPGTTFSNAPTVGLESLSFASMATSRVASGLSVEAVAPPFSVRHVLWPGRTPASSSTFTSSQNADANAIADGGRGYACSPSFKRRNFPSSTGHFKHFSNTSEKCFRSADSDPYSPANLALAPFALGLRRFHEGTEASPHSLDAGPVLSRQGLPLSRVTRCEMDSTFHNCPRQTQDFRTGTSEAPSCVVVTTESLQRPLPSLLDGRKSEADASRKEKPKEDFCSLRMGAAQTGACTAGTLTVKILPDRGTVTGGDHGTKDSDGRTDNMVARSGSAPFVEVEGGTESTSISEHTTEQSSDRRENSSSSAIEEPGAEAESVGYLSEPVIRWRSPSLMQSKTTSSTLPSVGVADWVSHKRLSMKQVVQGILAVIRMQVSADTAKHGPDCSTWLQIISTVLATPEAYLSACQDLWDRISWEFKLRSGEVERRMPASQIPRVFAHLRIPQKHVSLFWATLRQQDERWELAVLPNSMDFLTFKAVLAKVLRRVRNKSVGLSVGKTQFVRKNIRNFEDEYIERARIGEGSFGQCFWVEHCVDKRRFACKRILKDMQQVPCEEIEVELNLMKQLDHPFVLRVFEWFETADAYLFILEGAHGGDVKHLLTTAIDIGHVGLEERVVCCITKQTSLALAYIHSHCIIHRDVKPANMLLAQPIILPATPEVLVSMRILIADFGVSELFKSSSDNSGQVWEPRRGTQAFRGTVPYMSPEIFTGDVSASADIWAAGVCVCELLGGCRPFSGENPMAVYSSVLKKEPDLSKCVEAAASEAALEFVKFVLVKDHKVRPTAQECVSHEWLANGKGNHELDGVANLKARRALKQFTGMSSFSKTVANCIAAQIDSQKVEQLTQTFLAMDRNGDGVLDVAELKEGLQTSGLDVDNIEDLIDHMDVNRDGRINYTEFLASFFSVDHQLEEKMMQSAFRFFDTNGDGVISMHELRASLSNGGPLATMLPDGKTVEQVLKEIDVSKDGSISLQEFTVYLHKERANSFSEATAAAVKAVSPNRFSLQSSCSQSCCIPPNLIAESSPKGAKDEEFLSAVLLEMGVRLNKEMEACAFVSQVRTDYSAICADHAQRLAEQHWLMRVKDLKDLGDNDWPHLGLPLKLQRMLQNYVHSP
eukprot:TRINITY_DN11440_c0_g2_i1.p1 TRINITY_DN11440_c0_g2~~TRINITY_DN11440_c0_g2_i1.p1  ORF type:complete len:1254 (+),score=166.87 TRINITY_DN11440_c0_g2_i1:98-3859(+)